MSESMELQWFTQRLLLESDRIDLLVSTNARETGK